MGTHALAERAGHDEANISEILELAGWAWLKGSRDRLDDSRDSALLEQHAEEIEAEVREVLLDQVEDTCEER